MYSDNRAYVKSCLECQRSKMDKHVRQPPLHPIPPEEAPFERPKEGYKYILLIIDSFSKFPEAFPTFTQEAMEVAKILYNGIICQCCTPRSILTDKGQCFMSKLVKEICKIFQITKINTCSYNPQGNGTAERFNSVINQTLKIYCHEDQAR